MRLRNNPALFLVPVGVLSVLGISFVGTPVAAQKKPAAKAKAPARARSLSGTGFTLQDRSGALDADAREYLGNAKTEAAVKKALKYLAETQNTDGSWGDSRFSSDVGIVGLCSLAFMAAGHQP